MQQPAGLTPINDIPATILLVEDNPINRKVTLILLERLGLLTQIAVNGREAVDAVGREKFSVILMDCHMPEMDGFEATVAIRRLEALGNQYTPIIAVTALAMSGDRERCIAAGMDDYIPKPIDRDVLKIKLNHWLNREVVYRQQKLTHKVLRAHSQMTLLDKAPIDLDELAEFYGEDQVRQLIGLFVDNTQDMLKRLEYFVKAHDANSGAKMAHELKGSSASVGATQMSKLALYLEQAIGQQDWLEAEETIESLRRAFNHCQDIILTAAWAKTPSER